MACFWEAVRFIEPAEGVMQKGPIVIVKAFYECSIAI